MTKYIGWIPSIIGNLSYSLIGNSKYPTQPNVSIFEYNGISHYIVSQTRISHDFQLGLAALIPKAYAKKYEAYVLEKRGICSTWKSVLIGTCKPCVIDSIVNNTIGKNFQILEGQVFFIPKTENTYKLLELLETSVSKINEKLSNKNSGFDPEEAFKVKIEIEIFLNELLKIKKTNFSLIACDFELKRNGICLFSNMKKIIYNSSSDVDIEGTDTISDEHSYNQAFYFLKDIFHTHKFHSPDYDTLTQVYKFNENDKNSWAIETLKNLYRSAIRFSPENSLGVMYYARALKDIIRTSEEQEISDGFSFLDENLVSDEHAENVCKLRSDAEKKRIDSRKWIAGLFGGGLLLTWSRIYNELFVALNVTDKTQELTLHFVVPFLVAWAVVSYAGLGKSIGISKTHQLKKLIKYPLVSE